MKRTLKRTTKAVAMAVAMMAALSSCSPRPAFSTPSHCATSPDDTYEVESRERAGTVLVART